MTSSPLGTRGPFGRFADHLLASELPDLTVERRGATVAFVCRRADQVPTPLRIGLVALSVATGGAARLFGLDRTTAFLRATSLPVLAELARMVRSLGFAYVWETWPRTSSTGGVG